MAPKKAAFKLHLGLDHDGLIPAFAEVSEGLTSETELPDTFAFPKGSVLVSDRGLQSLHVVAQATDRQGIVLGDTCP